MGRVGELWGWVSGRRACGVDFYTDERGGEVESEGSAERG